MTDKLANELARLTPDQRRLLLQRMRSRGVEPACGFDGRDVEQAAPIQLRLEVLVDPGWVGHESPKIILLFGRTEVLLSIRDADP